VTAWFRSWRKRSSKAPTNPADPIDLELIPWLMATAISTTFPHFDSVPPWLFGGALLTIAWRIWLWRRGVCGGPAWQLILLAIAGAGGIVFEYRTLFGREPGVALLVLLMSLKLLELRTARDAVVVIMLGYFLLLTHYFYAESIPVGIWMLCATTVTTATLIRTQAPRLDTPAETLRQAARFVAQAIPVMVVLFFLFPRIDGPLWGLPQDAKKASSGLSDEMSPGSISELSQSTALAFRVEFKGQRPARDLLYWRGPVMSNYDGRTWRISRSGNQDVPTITPARDVGGTAALVEYAMTLEPHQQRWLLALDMPVDLPINSLLTPSLSVIHRNPVRDRMRFEFSASPRYRAGVDESPARLDRLRELPRDFNPKTRALAAEWRSASPNPKVISAKALLLFQQENFVYTLTPPLLGRNAIDDFLFDSRRGFCEHYASAYVFMMRAAGIPARVIGGYLGGEVNPIDGHLAVRQSDAHAWAEIWLAGEGWIRVDPTAAVAPNRIEQGLQASLPEGEALPAALRPDLEWLRALRYRWDAVDYAWNLWVLGYNMERQRQVLNRLGIGTDWTTLVGWLTGLTGTTFMLLGLWIIRRKPDPDRAHALWLLACKELARRGWERLPGEGPTDFANRVNADSKEFGALAIAIANHYIRLRYAMTESNIDTMYNAVGKLVPHWKLWSYRL